MRADVLSVRFFPPSSIAELWPELEPMLARSIAQSKGTLSTIRLRHWLETGKASLLCAQRDGRIVMAMVVMRIDYAEYNACRIIACAGRELAEAMKHVVVLKAWAVMKECIEIEAWCRPAMVRLAGRWGWKPKFAIVSMDLRERL